MNDLPETDMTDEELSDGLDEVLEHFEEKEDYTGILNIVVSIVGFAILVTICAPIIIILTLVE